MSKVKKSIVIGLVSGILVIAGTAFSFGDEDLFRPLPADALPPSEQVLYTYLGGESGTYIDFMKTIYNVVGDAAQLVQPALTAFNKDLEVVPYGAESWEVSKDGLTWTFHLRKTAKWSDGKPITAYDYEFAIQRCIKEGYDFSWYYSWAAGIKNWKKVEKGELPLEELGVKVLDDYTLTVTTDEPKPYLPAVLAWFHAVPRHAVEKYGDEYATRAETMVCGGPFKVSEWIKGDHITLVSNPYYSGPWKPYLRKIVFKYGTSSPEAGFPAYLNNEIYLSILNPGQLAYAKKNIPEQLHPMIGSCLWYLSFDTTKPPFDDIRVRRAFGYALNREEMGSTVLKGVALPEYSILMKGFPGSDPDYAKKLSPYDPELARKLLAEVGYPGGKGFPKLEMWMNAGSGLMATQKPAAAYIQAHFKKVLGVDITPRAVEPKTFLDAVNKHTHNFFLLAYSVDYIDPSNYMDLFLTGGRHTWSNLEYDELVHQADVRQDWEERIKRYRRAEAILILEAPAVFCYQEVVWRAAKPFLKGEAMEPNNQGIVMLPDAISGLMFKYAMTHIYIAKH